MADPVELVLEGKTADLGGFTVRRALPQIARRHVGPFVFFDHMGPAEFAPGKGVDVRPHPHIGLATVTYLFDGEIVHRDSLGYVQPIRPGDVNLMTAGGGIVHSERTGDARRASGGGLHGIQSWIALPLRDEETAPAFDHHPAATLPIIERDGVRLCVIMGAAYGVRAPVRIFSPMFYVEARAMEATTLAAPDGFAERALYVVAGEVRIGGQRFHTGQLITLATGAGVAIAADAGAHVMLFGGEKLDGPRHIWWNFVSSSKERLERAKSDWAEGRFAAVPGESEFIPLPR